MMVFIKDFGNFNVMDLLVTEKVMSKNNSAKLLLIIVGFSIFLSACTNTGKSIPLVNTNQNAGSTAPTQNSGTNPQTYTMNYVSNHNTKNDCWFVIDNSVYDVTNFISNHPGGSIIVQGCGKDASVLFNSVAKHKSQAIQLLNTLKVGELKK
ncbi:MAG: hypothetical protein COZ34_02630 [Candidatus Pacebacteria bacterium CG_4_10_14_3_um_filter_34_15]|nr:MAG: hypothetical protein COV78_02165 [Candidatus Pacebacteria bacterium CG11_big_fil_rev_8_21_14_0_20_34_55]PIX81544.1 MAG: hypothetical protein COZ34_02630 [Candidatus Pacebacteria bacterium CG_4_10_14_3_um_filter_34_15]PJC43931.1 MAG: hypothetical protein CO039_01400 [Candidatus Pacebacteria bacterium CG_4_9_14_0_2_um_filter_34_50]